MDISPSKTVAIAFGILQGSVVAMVVIGCFMIGGNAPSLQEIILVVIIFIVCGVVLCVAVAPARLSWNSKELTIKRVWGIETIYPWSELIGISSYGVKFGICFLQFRVLREKAWG
jgi:histidinol dehydrogenase